MPQSKKKIPHLMVQKTTRSIVHGIFDLCLHTACAKAICALFCLILLTYSTHAFALDRSLGDERIISGPHGDERIISPKGVCATCHIPHYSKGRKIWARTSNKPGLYDGIHQLCQTCHDGTMFSNGAPLGQWRIYTSDQSYTRGSVPPTDKYTGKFIVKETNKGEKEIYASTGTDDVLDEKDVSPPGAGPYESHVMHGGADTTVDNEVLIFFDPTIFPLDPNDQDTHPQPPAPPKYRSDGTGFYCGSCHNPHKQPDQRPSGGFYLRTRPGYTVGDPWNKRKPFCIQCHGEIHAPESDCLACHHPHLGKTLIKDNEAIGRKIFIYPVVPLEFVATPNVLKITEREGDLYTASFCYACHNGSEGNLWKDAGAVPIYGDPNDGVDIQNDKGKEHHPMGNQAWNGDSTKISNGIFKRAPGTTTNLLNQNGELTCTSCHDGFHGPGPYSGQEGAKGKNKKNNFLRWEFNTPEGVGDPKSKNPNEDSAAFCVKCHSDKASSMLSGKHLQTRDTAFERNVKREIYADPNSLLPQKVGCANCMLCHFIHDGEERQTCSPKESIESLKIIPEVDSLMRIPAKTLIWGDRSKEDPPEQYEDLCFGCHGDQAIVKTLGAGGSLLDPEKYFSHPFHWNPQDSDVSLDTNNNAFPVSDGKGIKVLDDYGVEGGDIYCGTCHDVHRGQNKPYLRTSESPYKAYGFCEACHNQDNFVAFSHPIDRVPNPDKSRGPVTSTEFKDELLGYIFSSGGSGRPGGVTFPYNTSLDVSLYGGKGKVICLTCHNTHAAATSPDGETMGDTSQVHGKLLVKDNFPTNSTGSGDELCRGCHDRAIFPLNGKHNENLCSKDPRGICHNCHLPHKAKSVLKIWAKDPPDQADAFEGVHNLCYSCHNTSDSDDCTSSGEDSVFKKGTYENHVMFGGAEIEAGACPKAPSLELAGNLDTDHFPLDPNDFDNIPETNAGSYCNRAPFSYSNGGKGVYCGTCHNPHKDPSPSQDPNTSSDYLRVKDQASIGKPGQRKPFCIQCHGNIHAPGSDCLACHQPHKGKTLIKDDERMGRMILSQFAVVSTPFAALPNIPEITDDPNDINPSRFCYACHNPETGLSAGIPVIYGDDPKGLRKEYEHHPMGTQASLLDPGKSQNMQFIRAPGTPIEYLNAKKQITCTSCHDGLHGSGEYEGQDDAREKNKKNNFLRWEFNTPEGVGDPKSANPNEDSAAFCVKCHSDKASSMLSGKHLRTRATAFERNVKRQIYVPENGTYVKKEVGSANCMFCHFIHDGQERQTDLILHVGIRPDVDSLMRFPSVNLAWGDRTADTDIYDYEDMCFGCHGSQSIVKGIGTGSLLDPNGHFTHPFALPADPNIIGQGFPVSDGAQTLIPDDYGAQAGAIYCGTCHDVHDNRTAPYLASHPSPYEPNGMCEACHNKNGDFLPNSHPIGVGPNPDGAQGSPTKAAFSDFYHGGTPLFSQGGSGKPGGVTSPYDTSLEKSIKAGKGEVICLTCHNTHAAVTSGQGKTKQDSGINHGKLLVKDNMINKGTGTRGSELCKACHPFGASESGFPSGDHGTKYFKSDEDVEYGICYACHFPHGAKGPKLWSRTGYGSGPFQGFRQLCFTCHYKGSSIATTGGNTVFKGVDRLGGAIPAKYDFEDHVMRNWASLSGLGHYPTNGKEYYDPNIFSLDPNDQDVIPRGPKPVPDPHEGFYCGSCHNPHIQQQPKDDYLRSKDGFAGRHGKRKEFCIECHIDKKEGHHVEYDCLICHHPHGGIKMLEQDPNVGRLIFITDPPRARDFTATPNVNGFTGDDESSKCYGCHSYHTAFEDPNAITWLSLGATPIYGDDVTELDTNASYRAKGTGPYPMEHHPMGKNARFGQSLKAPGADRSLFNRNGELTCTSCHSAKHEGQRENNYLRWDFTKDNSHFCLRCHPNKQEPNLGPPGGGHHQTKETSPLPRMTHEMVQADGKSENRAVSTRCANCMFCHFIHDGEGQGTAPAPALETLMRVKPVNLRWADSWQDEDTLDYEDLCYGCHSMDKIVGGVGGMGGLIVSPQDLSPNASADPILGKRFSHRFRSAPNPASPTAVRLVPGSPFPLSDGTGGMVIDDYGTEAGHMYCGTCHDVHTWAANPGTKYLRGLTSPYVPGGFCQECHSADPLPSVCTPALNHRLAPAPEGSVSVIEWSPLLYSNVDPALPRGKGDKGGFIAAGTGITPNFGQMTCLTCHNIHAAETTYDGFTDSPHSSQDALIDGRHGKLLIIDNGHGPAGSDLCINCHPDHSQIVGSAHDFSHRGLDGMGAGIADKGVCSACHRPHIALGEKLLWARPMTEEKALFGAVPGFALGSTLFCYDCHAGVWCDASPPPELFLPYPPQDIAFMDGPGGIVEGYYEPLPSFVQDIPPHRIPSGMPTEVKTSGHYIRQPIITNGIAQNDKMACNDCHNPHRGITKDGFQNQAFIRSVLGGKPMGPYKASINMTYRKETRDNLESRQGCVACHGLAERPGAPVYPPSSFIQVNPLYTSVLPLSMPTKTVYDHFDVGLYACTDCHKHNRAMVLCIDCHGYPPITKGDGWSGPGDTDQNYQGGAGAHYTHVVDHQFTCTMCHLGCLHDPGGATVVNPVFKRGKVSIDFDMTYKFPRTSGEFQTKMTYYGTDGKPLLQSSYNPVNQTCKVGCHNPLIGDPDEPPNLDNATPSWSLQVPSATTLPTVPQVPSWIDIRTTYPVPIGVPGVWQIPWSGQ